MLRQSYKRESEYIGLQLKPSDCHIPPVPSNILRLAFFLGGGMKATKTAQIQALECLRTCESSYTGFCFFFPLNEFQPHSMVTVSHLLLGFRCWYIPALFQMFNELKEFNVASLRIFYSISRLISQAALARYEH